MGSLRNRCLYQNFIRDVNARAAQLNNPQAPNPQAINHPFLFNSLLFLKSLFIRNNLQTFNQPQALNNPVVLNNLMVINNIQDSLRVLVNNLVPGYLDNSRPLSEFPTQLEQQQPLVVEKSELEIVQSLPKKQFAESQKKSPRTSKKRKRAFEMLQSNKKQKCDPKISNLSRLSFTSVKKSRSSQTKSNKESCSTKTSLISPKALKSYAKVKHRLKCVDRIIESYFKNKMIADPRADMSSIRGMTIVKGKLIIKVPSTLKRRNVYVDFHIKLGQYALQLAKSIRRCEKYLDRLKCKLSEIRDRRRSVRRLKKKLGKAYKAFHTKPEHQELKTAFRQLDLVEILVEKFDKLHFIIPHKTDTHIP